ncbi:beta-phosphoglucomutase [Maricurvus nonylphenolicus]|uniref:beta-phosphoglucomutase n=1 Tax=Maricurvus nonylphenolicus TaxID=1008307 RepID=UPI0036F316F5
MNNTQHFDAVIFDLDGVIANTAKFHFLAWRQLAEELGIHLPDEAESRLKGLERMASLELILAESDAHYSETQKQLLADKKNKHYCRLIETLTPMDLLRGAGELLEQLVIRDIPVALASASKNAAAVIERLGIAERFTYIADANRVQNPKPDPEIFLMAAQGLNIAPAACLAIEDAAAGVESINRAGMFSVGVGNQQELGEANKVIGSLNEFSVEDYFKS